jgi:oxygen-independent coproporphyrinogen-3 oxidase
MEARLRPEDFPDAPETVYFGGGTPSLLGADGFKVLVASLASAGITPAKNAEWTVELNPASVTDDLLRAMRRAGVNRLSIGAQSFCDATLARIGRIHDADAIRRAFAMARAAGFDDVGLDLIANLPSVTREEWDHTLSEALGLAPRHISVYTLSIEPGTRFAALSAAGTLGARLDDDGEMNLVRDVVSRLAAEGFARYEVSNYALPGYECRHNLAVWRGEDYTGLGPAAASRNGLRRRTNAPDLRAYANALAQGDLPPASESETLSAEDDAAERFVYGLRLAEGVSPADFALRHPSAAPLAAAWEERLKRLESLGLATRIGAPPGSQIPDPKFQMPRWHLTPRGLEVCDSAIAEILG